MYEMSSGGYSMSGGYGGQGSGYDVSMGYQSSQPSPFLSYNSGSTRAPEYSQPEQHAAFISNTFLKPDRPWTPIISDMGEVKEVVEQTFEKLTGQQFPEDSIRIVIAKPEDFQRIYESTGGHFTPGIMGFSFNKYGKGVSEIYVKQDNMDALLLTVGHEVGHILSPTLPNGQDEEAKAHAFSIAWMETIRENNIAGLQPNISLNPAQNGLHDVAYDFVKQLMTTGASAFDIFSTLSQGLTSILAEV